MRGTPISRRQAISGGAALALAAALPVRAAPKHPTRPLVFGHRGAPALRPEHTLASYAKAIADGADFIEPDLVATKDGVLVARHENNIAETTDEVARPEFAGRLTTKMIDGATVTGWFTEDFTLAELKQLRARERLGGLRPESQSFDGAFQIVTFEEIADFVAAEAAARGRQVGLIPEVKHGTYFAGIGLAVEPRFLQVLVASPYLRRAPVIVQSFEVANLKTLRRKVAGLSNFQLMQLIDAPQTAPFDAAASGRQQTYADMLTPAGLLEIASYADWVSPNDCALIPLGPEGRLATSSGVAARPGALSYWWEPGPSVPRTASWPPTFAMTRARRRATPPAVSPRSAATSPRGWMASLPMIRHWVGRLSKHPGRVLSAR